MAAAIAVQIMGASYIMVAMLGFLVGRLLSLRDSKPRDAELARCAYRHPDDGRCELVADHMGAHRVLGYWLCDKPSKHGAIEGGPCILVRGHDGDCWSSL